MSLVHLPFKMAWGIDMKMRAVASAILATLACPAFAQLRVEIHEPTYPIARDRVDTISCPGNRKIEVAIGYRRGAIAPGQSKFVVAIKVDDKSVDASVIEPYLVGYNVMSSDVTLAGCPDKFSDIFSG